MTWTPEPDAAGRLYPTYDVIIRRARDGEERIYHDKCHWHASSWFWWTDGNGACDCNRRDFFDRAGGMSEDEIWERDSECGDEAYRVLRFDFPDGTSLAGPDAMTPKPLPCPSCDE